MQPALVCRIRHDRIDADDWTVKRAGYHIGKLARPQRIGRPQRRVIDDRRGDHAVARNEIRRKTAGHAETDNAAATCANRELQELGRFAAPAHNEYARPRCDSGFEGQADQRFAIPLRIGVHHERARGHILEAYARVACRASKPDRLLGDADDTHRA